MIRWLIGVLLFFFAQPGRAQYLREFNAIQSGNGVELSFIIAGGNTCNGIDILRSTDSLNYYVIGDIAGICGSPTEDTRYSYTDRNPVPNARNFYRLDLRTLGYAGQVSVFVLYFEEERILLFPNPVSDRSSVYFAALQSELNDVHILDRMGRFIKSYPDIRGNYFELNREGLVPGSYIISIRNARGQARNRIFIVQ